MMEHPIVALAAIGLLGFLCQWLAWRVRLPAILFLLLTGIALGPLAGLLDPDALFGELLFPIVSLAVAVILFEGSLTLRFAEIAGLGRAVRRFVGVGVLVTWLVVTLAARWLVGLSWEIATLFGAIMVVTGPTVIVPMLRTVRPTTRIASILRWEGIVIDPIGALLAVLVFQFIAASGPESALGETVVAFLEVVAVGTVTGLAAGYALGEALRRDWFPEYLIHFGTLGAVFGAFALADVLAAESGLLAVTVMGIWLGNREGVPVDEILAFKESLSLLLVSGLFVLLAARLQVDEMLAIGPAALLVFIAVQFVARPLKVVVSTWGTDLSWPERGLLAWIAPRGIVAAAVASVFALQLERQGFAGAELLVPLTFVVIIGTVVLQSLSAGPMARALKVQEPEPTGFLIIGANPVARAVGKALAGLDLPVLLTDTQWDNLRQARMLGLRAYHGHPLSDHAELYLDLTGLGNLLALTPDTHLNSLACVRFGQEFGQRRVYGLGAGKEASRRKAARGGCRRAFGETVTYAELARRVARGEEIRVTGLTEGFGFEEYRERNPEGLLLFAADAEGGVQVVTAEAAPEPGPGWSLVALMAPPANGSESSKP